MNKVILMGRMVADPELRQTPSNISVCKFTIAVDQPYKSGEEKKADFINCTAWRNTADFISKYFSKGKPIIVEGSLHNNNYTDANGVKHYGMDVTVDKVNFCLKSDGGSDNQASTQQASNNSAAIADAIGDLGDFEEILSDGDVPF